MGDQLRRILIAIAGLTMLAAACGGDEGEEATGSIEPTGATAATGVTAATGATVATGPTTATGSTASDDCVDLTGEGEVFTIVISGFAFVPDCFTASASQAISIENQDSALHSFTIDGTQVDADFEGGTTFTGPGPFGNVLPPGTYDFYCKYHAAMVGEVTIVE